MLNGDVTRNFLKRKIAPEDVLISDGVRIQIRLRQGVAEGFLWATTVSQSTIFGR
jgi:hypothetical protein